MFATVALVAWLVSGASAVAQDSDVVRRPVIISRAANQIIFEVRDGDEFWFEFCRIRDGYCRTITSSLADTPEVHRRLESVIDRRFERGLNHLDLRGAAGLGGLALIPGGLIGLLGAAAWRRGVSPRFQSLGTVAALGALAAAAPTGALTFRRHGGRRGEVIADRGLSPPPHDRGWIDLDEVQSRARPARATVWLFYKSLRRSVNEVARDLDKNRPKVY